ncbi:signal-transducing adaptor protein 2 isoform 2-T2 [Discoglossus pictus]
MMRVKVPLPDHYYEEYLYKKDQNDKVFKKFWVGLLGNSLCFYTNHKELLRLDCLCLDDYVCLKEPPAYSSAPSEYIFTLCLQGREVQLKAESLESREMWRAYIITMAELRIPPSLTLLPGPLLALREALEKEKERRVREEEERRKQMVSAVENDDDIPSCFFNISRMEAESLLKQNPECGSLLLRPGGTTQSVSVTTCQQIHGKSVMKHYKVTQEPDGYVIQVEPRVYCHSLKHVISHFMKSSNNLLVPFDKLNEYENQIGIFEVNKEDGVVVERVVQGTPVPTKNPPKIKMPPPLPPGPPPQEEYENPNEGQTARNTMEENLSSRRRSDPPFNTNWKVKGYDGASGSTPIQNKPGLDEELRQKLKLRRKYTE